MHIGGNGMTILKVVDNFCHDSELYFNNIIKEPCTTNDTRQEIYFYTVLSKKYVLKIEL